VATHAQQAALALVGPVATHAQQAALALVGLLSGSQVDNRSLGAIRQGLKDAGYIEGRNLAIKYHSADARFEQLPVLAAAIYYLREFADIGGLISYGASITDAYRPHRRLCRAHSQRGKAGRIAGPANGKI
jgi:hypothetical protein